MTSVSRFPRVGFFLGLFAAATLGFPGLGLGQGTTTLIDDVLQPNTIVNIGTGESGAINPAGDPFTFAGAANLIDIQSIAITLTLIDGDTGTGPNDSFRDSLTLRLDGIETGLVLNGFSSAADEGNVMASDYIRLRLVTSGPIPNAAAILAALQGDNQLTASLYESIGISMANSIGLPSREFGSSTPTITAILEITGTTVPEPGTWAFLLLGGSLLFLVAGRRRIHRRKAATN